MQWTARCCREPVHSRHRRYSHWVHRQAHSLNAVTTPNAQTVVYSMCSWPRCLPCLTRRFCYPKNSALVPRWPVNDERVNAFFMMRSLSNYLRWEARPSNDGRIDRLMQLVESIERFIAGLRLCLSSAQRSNPATLVCETHKETVVNQHTHEITELHMWAGEEGYRGPRVWWARGVARVSLQWGQSGRGQR